jgi:hypothetical protein
VFSVAKRVSKEEKILVQALSIIRMPANEEEAMAFLDAVESKISEDFAPAEVPVLHSFSLGFYVRQVLMLAGTTITSKIHRTRHAFVMSEGDILVWSLNAGVKRYSGYNVGITEPGTRRLLCAIEDTVWTTFHETKSTDLAEIEKEIIQPHENPLLHLPGAPRV